VKTGIAEPTVPKTWDDSSGYIVMVTAPSV